MSISGTGDNINQTQRRLPVLPGTLLIWPHTLPICRVAPSSHVKVVEVIEDRARDGRLHELLQRYHSSRTNRVIIFVLYKKEAVRVEQFLQRKGWKVRSLADGGGAVGWLGVYHAKAAGRSRLGMR